MLARRFKRPSDSYFMTLLLTTNRVYAIGFAFLLNPGAQQGAAGTTNTTLFDIVNAATGNGSLRAPRLRTSDPPHPEGVAQRRVSKDGRPPLDLRGLMVRDSPGGAPHHEVSRETPRR